eukprot:TRINITY_DN41928_c0_g1_i1.p1 TRINITY_DN41928_c0_g1~~TRINITY_DN41928_c0_g1_i1.p1  ORF type:complete len:107 (+),score=8.20 TRINITY_DN41928_c0_g1_i1:584-904(+)
MPNGPLVSTCSDYANLFHKEEKGEFQSNLAPIHLLGFSIYGRSVNCPCKLVVMGGGHPRLHLLSNSTSQRWIPLSPFTLIWCNHFSQATYTVFLFYPKSTPHLRSD